MFELKCGKRERNSETVVEERGRKKPLELERTRKINQNYVSKSKSRRFKISSPQRKRMGGGGGLLLAGEGKKKRCCKDLILIVKNKTKKKKIKFNQSRVGLCEE